MVLDAIDHPVMRRWSRELLEGAGGCWCVDEPGPGEMVADAIGRTSPAVLVVDDTEFPACCRTAIDAYPPDRVIVIGTEPDSVYRAAAIDAGAGGWVSRDHVGEQLAVLIRRSLGCPHDRCPPDQHDRPSTSSASPACTPEADLT